MNIRKQRKKKLALLHRNNCTLVLTVGEEYPKLRKNATYYTDWCCKDCYFGWGPGAKYKHNCAQSNNIGILKKYWKEYDLWVEDDVEINEGENNAS